MSRNRRPQRRTQPRATLTYADAGALSADLLNQLAPHAGDREKICAVLFTWLEKHGVHSLSTIAVAAVERIFSERLTRVPATDAPAGAIWFTPTPKETP